MNIRKATEKDLTNIETLIIDAFTSSPYGYQKAASFNITPPFKVEDQYFLIKELFPNALKNIHGPLSYNPAFE